MNTLDLVDVEGKQRPRVALVLGSGGARGFAHIGVIDVLLQADVQIVAVSGTSMGAMVGGMFASSKLEDFREWVVGLGRMEMVRMLDVSLTRGSAVRGERLFAAVGEILDGALIEDQPIDYTAVAVDLISRRQVWFQSGPLDLAIRASSAIPSFFRPVESNGRLLVDGAILDPLPVAPVAAAHVDAVIAVSLQGHGPSTMPDLTIGPSDAEWSSRIWANATRWFDSERFGPALRRAGRTTHSDDAKDAAHDVSGANAEQALSALDVVQVSYEIMQAALTTYRLAGFAPDHLITIPKTACRTLDFHRAAEMIELGRQVATEALGDLFDRPSN